MPTVDSLLKLIAGFKLQNNPCSHPIFFMNGVKQTILKSILDFMYLGEVRINQEDFTDFIRVAELFKIRGVTRDQVRQTYSLFEETVVAN